MLGNLRSAVLAALTGLVAGADVAEDWSFEKYTRLSYERMHGKLAGLATQFPDSMLLENQDDKFGIPYLIDCDSNGGGKCVLDIVTVTDFASPPEDKVQVYISGALHGNERIGPHVAYYLIEYLVSNFGKDPYITNLLRTREIVITPMTNTFGFAKNLREELCVLQSNSQKKSFDPNRDFPYNNAVDACLNTVAGRTIYKLMVENLFVSSITFHGGINVIGYPWGSNNHVIGRGRANEAPDHTALNLLGEAMFEAAGDNITSLDSNSVIRKYILGDMTSTVYPVGGGMEDWAYGAGWDNKKADAGMQKCEPVTSPALGDDFFESQENVRSAIYLLETDGKKNPSEQTYGARNISYSSHGDFRVSRASIEDKDYNNRFDGHINRNIRLATAMIDMSKPYLAVSNIRIVSEEALEIAFTVNGCIQIDEVSVEVNGEPLPGLPQIGYCNHLVPSGEIQTVFKVAVKVTDKVVLGAVVDQKMAQSENSSIVAPNDFINDPQTHFAKLRLQDNYRVEQKGKFVQASRLITLDVTKYLAYVPAMKSVSPEEIIRFPQGWSKIGRVEEVQTPVEEETANDEVAEETAVIVEEELPVPPFDVEELSGKDDNVEEKEEDETNWDLDNNSGEASSVVTWSSILPAEEKESEGGDAITHEKWISPVVESKDEEDFIGVEIVIGLLAIGALCLFCTIARHCLKLRHHSIAGGSRDGPDLEIAARQSNIRYSHARQTSAQEQERAVRSRM